jgi:hypothetical protein
MLHCISVKSPRGHSCPASSPPFIFFFGQDPEKAQTGLKIEIQNPPASASQMLGLQAFITMPSLPPPYT